jgi:hypothetical protein
MRKERYLPTNENERVVWFNTFVANFTAQAAGLGFTPADVTAAANDAAMYAYLVLLVEIYTAAKEQRTEYKNLIKDGPIGSPGGALPVAPVLAPPATIVAPGIFPRLSALVARIKASPTYTETIGKSLGIIGADQSEDQVIMKPILKLVFKGGEVEIQWRKGKADAIHIETDKGAGTWSFLAVDTVPHYTDTTPITGPGIWKYRAIYLINDEKVGQWSDVASISVG